MGGAWRVGINLPGSLCQTRKVLDVNSCPPKKAVRKSAHVPFQQARLAVCI